MLFGSVNMNKIDENDSKYWILKALFVLVFIFALYIGYVKFMKYVDREYDIRMDLAF